MTRALIAGGCGFVGSHILRHFVQNTDWELVSLDRYSVSGTLHRLVESASRVVLDEPGLIQIYMELSPGYVPQLESEHLNILFKLPDSLEALLNRLGG